MKKIFIVLFALMLVSCENITQKDLTFKIKNSEDVEVGSYFPEGYSLKRFAVKNYYDTQYIYILYRDGEIVEGLNSTQHSGKFEVEVGTQIANVKSEEDKIKSEVDAYLKEGLDLQLKLQKTMEKKK